jgi:hypothetical protein
VHRPLTRPPEASPRPSFPPHQWRSPKTPTTRLTARRRPGSAAVAGTGTRAHRRIVKRLCQRTAHSPTATHMPPGAAGPWGPRRDAPPAKLTLTPMAMPASHSCSPSGGPLSSSPGRQIGARGRAEARPGEQAPRPSSAGGACRRRRSGSAPGSASRAARCTAERERERDASATWGCRTRLGVSGELAKRRQCRNAKGAAETCAGLWPSRLAILRTPDPGRQRRIQQGTEAADSRAAES